MDPILRVLSAQAACCGFRVRARGTDIEATAARANSKPRALPRNKSIVGGKTFSAQSLSSLPRQRGSFKTEAEGSACNTAGSGG